MNYTLVQGRPEDYEDIIDFGNYVFNEDFPSLLPKLYRNRSQNAQYHHLIKEGLKIKAMVGSFPLGLNICGDFLRVKGIGTVSVHKYSRGSGYMNTLMDSVVTEMLNENCDLAVLGGERQRYEYWGFTPCGINISINFNKSNIKHAKIPLKIQYEFIEFKKDAHEEALLKAINLHNTQLAHAVREKNDFVDICNSWNSRLIFVYNDQGFSGYICASSDGEKIREIVVLNPNEIDQIMLSYIKHYNLENVQVTMYVHRHKEFLRLSEVCKTYSIHSSTNINVINYKTVIKAFMKLKNSVSPLVEGVLILNIKEKGSYKIEVNNGFISVEDTDRAFDLSMSHLEASSLLFSHSTYINPAFDIKTPLVKAWFPLPLFYSEIDNV